MSDPVKQTKDQMNALRRILYLLESPAADFVNYDPSTVTRYIRTHDFEGLKAYFKCLLPLESFSIADLRSLALKSGASKVTLLTKYELIDTIEKNYDYQIRNSKDREQGS